MKLNISFSKVSLPVTALGVTLLAYAAFFLKAPFFDSFSLDETITMWVTSQSLGTTVERAWEYQGQSPLYFIFIWCVRQLFGSSEAVLRSTSVIMMVLCVFPLIDCAKRLNIKYGQVFIPLVFVSDPLVLRYSMMIRPYAFALFFACLCSAMLLRWMESGTRKYLYFYAVSFAAMLYFQYLFGPLAFMHLALYFFFRKELAKGKLLSLFTAWAAATVLLLPGVLHIISFLPKRAMLDSISTPDVTLFLRNIAPLELISFAFLGLLSGLLYVPVKLVKGDTKLLVVLLLWAVFPTCLLFALSLFTSGSYFIDRYYLWRIIGLALLTAHLFERFSSEHFLKITVFVWGVFLIILNSLRIFHLDDWKGLQTELRSRSEELPLLFHSGLIELNTPPYPDDTTTRDYLISPLMVYPVEQKVLPIPSHFESKAGKSMLKNEILEVLNKRASFVLATVPAKPVLFNQQRLSTTNYFEKLFNNHNFEVVEHRSRGIVHVLFFRRKS